MLANAGAASVRGVQVRFVSDLATEHYRSEEVVDLGAKESPGPLEASKSGASMWAILGYNQ